VAPNVGLDTLRPRWSVNSQICGQWPDESQRQHSVRSEASSQSEVANSAEMMEIDDELCQPVGSESFKPVSRAEVSSESNSWLLKLIYQGPDSSRFAF